MAQCKAMFTIVDDSDHEKSTHVVEYGPVAIEDNVHPVQGLISFLDDKEKEKQEWQKKEPKILTS